MRETPSTIVRHVRDYSEERSFDDKTGFERRPSPSVLSAMRANQEGKVSSDREVSGRNFCDIDFTWIDEATIEEKFMSIAGGVYL